MDENNLQLQEATGIDPLMRRITRILKGVAGFEDKNFLDHSELKRAVGIMRSMGARFAYTSGVWDMLHIGHCNYIQAGKDGVRSSYPDAEHWVMVVGADSDALTKKRKGPRRPIIPEDERLRMLAYMGSVDIVSLQDEKRAILEVVKPDLLVLSKTTKDLPPEVYDEFRPFCGNFLVLDPQAERTSSAMIRNLFLDGAETLYGDVQNHVESFIQNVNVQLNGLKGDLQKIAEKTRKLSP